MKKLLTTLAIVCFATMAMAGETVRCGTHLISEGDSITELLEHCGEPTTRLRNQWIYDFGENQFLTVVTLRGNDLDIDRIEQQPRE